MRLFVVVLALEVAVSTQAMAFGSHGRMTKKAEVNEGCPAAFYVDQVATVCTTRITPNLTVPIRTGRRATIR
jgi:hypothetical protein